MCLWVYIAVLLLVTGACTPSSTTPTELDAATSTPPQEGGTIRKRPVPDRSPRPQAAPDPRSQAQIAQAACTGPHGGWACGAHRPVLATGIAAPITPPSWTVPTWYIDPANATGCASDTNSGTAATCGGPGVGPLLSYVQLNAQRWGCLGGPTACPQTAQNTTITWLSSEARTGAPGIYAGHPTQGSYVTLMGVLGAAQQIGAGAITVVSSKSTTIAPYLLKVTLPGPGPYAAGQLAVNTTHPSRAWLYSQVSGNTWFVSQPLAPATLPIGYSIPTAEVDNWATGNSVTVYQPVTVNLGAVTPRFFDFTSALTDAVFVYQLNVAPSSFNSFGLPAFTLGPATDMVEASSGRAISTSTATHSAVTVLENVYSNTWGVTGVEALSYLYGGVYASINAGVVVLDQDVIMVNGGAVLGLSTPSLVAGPVYIESGPSALGQIGYLNFEQQFAGLTPSVYGPGQFRAFGTVNYTAGAGGAAASFLGGIVLHANGGAVGCVAKPSAASFGTCNITINASNLDSNLGATAGCIGVPFGGAFCNFTGGP